MARLDDSRNITERIYITGKLVLQSPAHFGNGAVRGDALVDMTLLLDDVDDEVVQGPRALIPGTTIAGALRSYLRERLHGYGVAEWAKSAVSDLFGPTRDSDDEGAEQSLLIVEDALSSTMRTTLRDGVRINPKTGTAFYDEVEAAGAKFDIELLEAGTAFDLNFELLLTEKKGATELVPYALAMLEGLDKGDIRLGLRKRRGYGRCRVTEWTVSRYQLTKTADLCAWLETPAGRHRPTAERGPLQWVFAQIFSDGQVFETPVPDEREQFSLMAAFGLAHSSLLIRSGFGEADRGADFVHLHAFDENGAPRAVIPGTSWAGVVRHRTLRIANTIAVQCGKVNEMNDLVDALFGRGPTKVEAEEARRTGKAVTGTASRATLDETYIDNGQSLYQTRVRIDRFTGGAFESALFEEAPVYGTEQTRIGFQLHVRDPLPYEIGLLLLVLKDLWTGDLPVGGESAVGRGRLTGLEATLYLPGEGETVAKLRLQRDQPDLGLNAEQRTQLQNYVDALWFELGWESDNEQ